MSRGLHTFSLRAFCKLGVGTASWAQTPYLSKPCDGGQVFSCKILHQTWEYNVHQAYDISGFDTLVPHVQERVRRGYEQTSRSTGMQDLG